MSEEQELPPVPIYDVGSYYSFRYWRHAIKFKFIHPETNETIDFRIFLFHKNEGKEKKLRFVFWFPWNSKKVSAVVFKADPVYHNIILNFLFSSFSEFTMMKQMKE